jgi:hypothetical protein
MISREIFQLETLNASETEQRRSDDVVPIEEKLGIRREDAGGKTWDCPNWFTFVRAALMRFVRKVVEGNIWRD